MSTLILPKQSHPTTGLLDMNTSASTLNCCSSSHLLRYLTLSSTLEVKKLDLNDWVLVSLPSKNLIILS